MSGAFYGTYLRLGVPVWASARAVIRRASKKIRKRSRFKRDQRKERHKFYREMLRHHANQQKLCRIWRM